MAMSPTPVRVIITIWTALLVLSSWTVAFIVQVTGFFQSYSFNSLCADADFDSNVLLHQGRAAQTAARSRVPQGLQVSILSVSPGICSERVIVDRRHRGWLPV